MAKAAEAAAASKSLIKREPVLIGSGIVTLLSTALYVAPAIGLKIPDQVQKALSVGLTAAGAFGIRSLVKPV